MKTASHAVWSLKRILMCWLSSKLRTYGRSVTAPQMLRYMEECRIDDTYNLTDIFVTKFTGHKPHSSHRKLLCLRVKQAV